MSEDSVAILGVQSCGCVTFAESRPEHMDKWGRDAIQRIIADGGQVIRKTVAEAREMPHFLPGECPHEPKGWEPAPDPDEPKVRYKRVSSRGVSRVYVKTRWNARWPAGEVRKFEGAWWATEGWFNCGEAGATDGGGKGKKPSPEFGPFKTQREAAAVLVPIAVEKSRELSERLSRARPPSSGGTTGEAK